MSFAGGDIHIRAATASDTIAVRGLLREADLPLDGVPEDLTFLLVAERTDGESLHLVGAVAVERHGTAALLRSTVVAPALRGTHLGEALVHRAIDDARRSGVRDLVLLTTTAHRWFPRFGFAPISRTDVPVSLQASREFQGACPASAIVMHRRLVETGER